MGAERGIPCSSLKTAGVVVAIVEALLLVAAVYGLFRNLHLYGSGYFLWFIVGVISVFVIILAIALLLYAIKFDKPRWLIPHLSAQIFLIFFLIVLAIVVAILLLFRSYTGIRNLVGASNYFMNDDSTILTAIYLIVIHLVVAALEIFFVFIIWKLYKHMVSYSKMEQGSSWQGPLPKDNIHGSPMMGDAYPYGQDREKGHAHFADNQGFGNQSFDRGYPQDRGFHGQNQPLVDHSYDRRY